MLSPLASYLSFFFYKIDVLNTSRIIQTTFTDILFKLVVLPLSALR